MKNYGWTMLIAILLVSLFSLGGFAQEAGVTFVEDPIDCIVYRYNEETQKYEETSLARAYMTDGKTYSCNKDWNVGLTTNASIAQWSEITFKGLTWNWYIRKPGRYKTECNEVTVQSNGDVTMKFTYMEDLKNDDDEIIPVWYKLDGYTAWLATYNYTDEDINMSKTLKNTCPTAVTFPLWNRIDVSDCTTPCEYSGTATLTFTMDNQKDWINSETGEFDSDYDYN